MGQTILQQRALAIVEKHDGLYTTAVEELAATFQPWDLHALAAEAADPRLRRMFRHAALLVEWDDDRR